MRRKLAGSAQSYTTWIIQHEREKRKEWLERKEATTTEPTKAEKKAELGNSRPLNMTNPGLGDSLNEGGTVFS